MNSEEADEHAKLFVGGLSRVTNTEGLKRYFEKFGEIRDCVVMYDPEGRSRCFGFVTFENPSVVDEILSKTHILDKKQIDPKKATPRSISNQQNFRSLERVKPENPPSSTSNKVFVGGIPVNADENVIRDIFEQFDLVKDVQILKDKDNISRGFAFVTFDSKQGVEKALKCRTIKVLEKNVDIQLAHPRLPKNPSTGKLSGQTVPLFQNNQNDFTNYFQNIIKSYADVYGPQAAAALSQYYEQYYTQYMSTYYNNMYGSTLGQQQQNIPSNNRDYSVGAISSDTTRRNRSKSPNRVKDPRY